MKPKAMMLPPMMVRKQNRIVSLNPHIRSRYRQARGRDTAEMISCGQRRYKTLKLHRPWHAYTPLSPTTHLDDAQLDETRAQEHPWVLPRPARYQDQPRYFLAERARVGRVFPYKRVERERDEGEDNGQSREDARCYGDGLQEWEERYSRHLGRVVGVSAPASIAGRAFYVGSLLLMPQA